MLYVNKQSNLIPHAGYPGHPVSWSTSQPRQLGQSGHYGQVTFFILVIVTSSLNQFYGPSVSPFRDLLIQVDPPPSPPNLLH